LSWQPHQAAGWLRPQQGEVVSLPESGPHEPREFDDDERDRVATVLDFELPFALEGLHGELAPQAILPADTDGRVLVSSRQKQPQDIAVSLRLAQLRPPRDGLIVASGDRYGRINVSAVQFQLQEFRDLSEADAAFGQCLRWLNRFIDLYNRATQGLQVRKVTRDDILAYRFAHVFEARLYNEVIQPVANVSLRAIPAFPRDGQLLWGLLNAPLARDELWARLIDEARYHLSIEAHTATVINCITALETVLRSSKGRTLMQFFERHGIVLEQKWLHRRHLDSVSVCLNLLNLLSERLGLDQGLTQRAVGHYDLRNAIVHHGRRRVEPELATACVEDTEQLIRHLLDRIHLSITARLAIETLPASDIEFDLVTMRSAEAEVTFTCTGSILTVTLTRGSLAAGTLTTDLSAAGWEEGSAATIAVTYDARAELATLIIDTEVTDTSHCPLGPLDASDFRPDIGNDERNSHFPLEFILVHNRVLQPQELADVESLFTSERGDQSQPSSQPDA